MVGRLFGIRGFVAGVLVASIVGAGGLAVVRATSGSSLASSFVPVTPVRVVDTRSDLGLLSLVDGVEQSVTVCVKKKSRVMRYAENGECASSETKVLLNQTGAKGDTGVAGAKGDTGAPGVDATVAITQQSVCDGIDADTTADELCKIGMTGPGGGHIFFVDYNDQYAGFNYLEAAPQGWSNGLSNVNLGGVTGETAGTATVDPKMHWCSDTSSLLGLNAWANRAVGIGGTNTTTADITCTSGAVQAASDLVLGGKDDWFLGSLGEMMLMFDNLQGVGGFASGLYWSSSDFQASRAWGQYFDTGGFTNGNKATPTYLRPVRAF